MTDTLSMDQITTIELPADLDGCELALDAVEAEIERLNQEQATFGADVQQAASVGHSDKMIALARRRDAIPLEIVAAKIRRNAILLQRERLTQPALKTEWDEKAKIARDLREERDALEKRHNLALRESNRAQQFFERNRDYQRQLAAEQAQLVNEAASLASPRGGYRRVA